MVDVEKIMEIQQSPLYASYIKSLGWHVVDVDGCNLFIKKFPFFGCFAKLQRSEKLPKINKLLPALASYHVKRLAVEPDSCIKQHIFSQWLKRIPAHISIVHSPYLPTKTIRVDLSGSQEELFAHFSEAKRRGVRRAQKNNLRIYESTSIQDLIKIKNKSSGFLGFITTTGIHKLWPLFAPNQAVILLAYRNSPTPPLNIRGGKGGVIVGGILLLFWDSVAYYWIAGATREGKKLFAPTLLVWEALKLSKKRGMKQFDFVGVWDERTPKLFHEWKGFTKFKEGFGGETLYYPIC